METPKREKSKEEVSFTSGMPLFPIVSHLIELPTLMCTTEGLWVDPHLFIASLPGTWSSLSPEVGFQSLICA